MVEAVPRSRVPRWCGNRLPGLASVGARPSTCGTDRTTHCRLQRTGPSVVTVHDLTLIEHPEWHERAKTIYFGHMIPAAVARATVCVCVSTHTARRLEELVPPADHGAARGRGDPARCRPRPVPRRRRRRRRPRAARRSWRTASVHRVPRHHRAAKGRPVGGGGVRARGAARTPTLRLVIAGGAGWDGGHAQRAISGSGVAHRIVRTGYLPDDAVPALFRRAGVVATRRWRRASACLPSRRWRAPRRS